jgi:transmembrane sensor
MMSTYYTIDDFLNDATFRAWVLGRVKVNKWEKMQMQPGEQREKLLQAKEILLVLDREGQDWSVNRQEKIFHQIRSKTGLSRKAKSPSNHFYRVLLFALGTLFLFGSIWWFDLATIFYPSPPISYVEEAIWVSKSNPIGQKSKIHLPDGSTVFLNAGSALRFRQDFGKSGREIYLQGEAFFEVAEDESLPFQVYCESLSITALGTSFNINSFQKGFTKVQLATGKVVVENETEDEAPVELSPGEEVIHAHGKGMQKRAFDSSKAFVWKNGTLLFRNTDLETFISDLERWYGVEINVVNPPKNQLRINGEFTEDYLSKVLEAIGYAYGFSYSIDQKQVVITFN